MRRKRRQPKLPLTEESERRVDAWQALSDLFLDIEHDDADRQRIARQLQATGFSPALLQHILWREVYPVLHLNLRCVSGVWTGFRREWLRKKMRPDFGPVRSPGRIRRWLGRLCERLPGGSVPRQVRIEWERVCEYMPEEFRKMP
ncbi:MAG: hypothetical protein LBS70_06575 [Candidatus Accumulibacter sp.]|nr:hypothetical protein [Accumulibacter sp.]